MDPAQGKLVMYATALASLMIALGPLIVLCRERYTLRNWIRTTARIQAIFTEKRQTTGGSVTESKRARYIFRTPDGELHEREGKVNQEPRTPNVGQYVEVRYSPRNPTRSSIYIVPRHFWYSIGIPWTAAFITLAGVCASDAIWNTMSN